MDSYPGIKEILRRNKMHVISFNFYQLLLIYLFKYLHPVPGVEIPNPNSELPPGLILLEEYVSLNSEQLLKDCIKWEDTDENASSMRDNCIHLLFVQT